MKGKIDLDINNPLIYIFMTFILSSVSYEIYNYNKPLAIIFVSGFFIILTMYKGMIVTGCISLFFIISLLNNIFYYNFTPKNIEEIRVEKINSYSVEGCIKGRNVILNVKNDNFKIGDRIIANGSYKEEVNLTNGIIGEYTVGKYKVLNKDFIYNMYRKREDIYEKVREKLGSRKASLITSVAFGYKEQLDKEDSDEMKRVGISHAIAVSGLHMGLIYTFISCIFGWRIALVIGMVYVNFTGASSSTLRAYIMIFIMAFGKVTNRNYNQISALSLAGIIILLFKPYDIFNLGFLLSFLAMLGIILFNENLNKKLYKLPGYIRKTIAISVSAQIFTFPLLVLTFNEFSIGFLIGNIVIMPLISILVVMGNVLLLAVNFEVVFNYLLYLCHYIIRAIDYLLQYAESINILYLNYTVAYFYAALLITYYFYKKGHKRFIFYPIIVAIYIFTLIYSPFINIRYYKEGALLISYKGERVLIQTKAKADKEKLRSIAITDNIVEDIKKVYISNTVYIEKSGKNYVLDICGNKHLLLVNYDKSSLEYDIIDFRKGNLQEVTVFNEKIITRK